MESKIIRCGNSSAVIINGKFMRGLGLKRGDRVEIEYDEEKGLMVVSFPGARQLSLTSRRV